MEALDPMKAQQSEVEIKIHAQGIAHPTDLARGAGPKNAWSL